MDSNEPLAWLITWRSYGTWLPGDPRGYVRRGVPGRQPPAPSVHARARSRMKHPPLVLTDDMRGVILQSLRDTAHARDWPLFAANVLVCHVHIAVTAPGREGRRVRDRFKANATIALREEGLIDRGRTVWARGGHLARLHDDASVTRASIYVLEKQECDRFVTPVIE